VELLLKNLLFTVVVPGTVAVYLPLAIARDLEPASGPWRTLSLLAFSLGALVYARCVWDFASFGRGTPAPIDAPQKLVIRGPYRIVRNPMYVGVLCVVLGWAARYASALHLLYAGAVGTAFHLFTVLYEEPHLRREFGEDYVRYCARVGRWLPRLHRPRAGPTAP
jgi:protein-S-isoprenylcysteine O-methyltransferase Ste14